MAGFAIPVLVYAGDYGQALVIKSLLTAAGIPVSFDGPPVGAHTMKPHDCRLYVAREDAVEARRLMESGRL
jgi:hypothetical protein